MKKLLLIVSFAFLFFIIITPNCKADDANIGGYGNTVKILNNKDVQMKNEIINIFVSSTSTNVEIIYNFVNTSNKQIEVTMGFPEKMDGNYTDSYKLNNFSVFEKNKIIETNYRNSEEAVTPDVNWYIHTSSFEPNEKKEVINKYWINNSAWSGGSWFNYVLETGASWKNKIEKVDIHVYFLEDISIYDVRSVKPANFFINEENQAIEWHIRDIEPTKDDNLHISWKNFHDRFKGACVCQESCRDYTGFDFNKTFGKSSSYLIETTSNYYPCYAFDNKPETAWVENVEGPGIGEWLNVPLKTLVGTLYDPQIEPSHPNNKHINKIKIFNGLGENEELWKKNNRLKKIKVFFYDQEEMIIKIPDVYGYQIIDLPRSITTNKESVRVEILETYNGSEYDDTAISEIRFLSLIEGEVLNSKDSAQRIYNNNLYKRLQGKIILKVEDAGKAFYINPKNMIYHYLGLPNDAFRVMREQGIGISEKDFKTFNGYAPKNLSGSIFLRVEANGEAYYVNPLDLRIHYLGRPSDAFNVMRNLGLGISNNNFDKL